ncbi:MAG: tetratricopeptide repeat protein [Leptospirales bacterium]|nr:tetratricopeptide repeat protein [Leptospirales bacterium]
MKLIAYVLLPLAIALHCQKGKVDSGSLKRAEELNTEGKLLFSRHQLEGAFSKFKSAAFFDPYNAEYPNNMGMCQMELGAPDQAITSFEKAIALKPELPLYHMNLGMAYEKLSMPEKATEAFQAAVDRDPGFQDGWLRLGMINLAGGKAAQAQEAWDKGSAAKPDAEYESTVGAYLVEKGNAASGKNRFLKAIQINPEFSQAHFNLGVVYQRNGDLKEAAKEYEKTTALEPRNFLAYYNLGVVQTRLEQKDKAQVSLKKFLELLPPGYPTQKYDAEQRLRDLNSR